MAKSSPPNPFVSSPGPTGPTGSAGPEGVEGERGVSLTPEQAAQLMALVMAAKPPPISEPRGYRFFKLTEQVPGWVWIRLSLLLYYSLRK